MSEAINQASQSPFEQKLVSYLSARLPGAQDISISELTRATECLSYETYLFQASWLQAGKKMSQGYAVRLQPLWGPVPPYDVEPQFRILQSLYGTEVPVPRVFWMEKVDGEIPLPWKSARSSYNDPAQRELMAREIVRVLAALHKMDWKARGIVFWRHLHRPLAMHNVKSNAGRLSRRKMNISPSQYWLRLTAG